MAYLKSISHNLNLSAYVPYLDRGCVQFSEDIHFSGVNRILSAAVNVSRVLYTVWKNPQLDSVPFWQFKYGFETEIQPDPSSGDFTVVRVKGTFGYIGDEDGGAYLTAQNLSESTMRFDCVAVCL